MSGQDRGTQGFPCIAPLGLDGILVRFGEALSDLANRAALAFHAALQGADLPGVIETATTLTSVRVQYDPLAVPPEVMCARIQTLLADRDWYGADLPAGRRRWMIPALFDGPALAEAAHLAGLTPEAAVAGLTADPLRVLAIGFAPGQPYLGTLPPAWDIPRQQGLTPRVEPGAITVALRQIVLFSVPSQTGWRQVGRCLFRPFQPDAADPFALRAGDEIRFHAIPARDYARLAGAGRDGVERMALP
ncbi:MAG: 5-oxoprolinase subunit B family protein [Qingshengfaniella sp.]